MTPLDKLREELKNRDPKCAGWPVILEDETHYQVWLEMYLLRTSSTSRVTDMAAVCLYGCKLWRVSDLYWHLRQVKHGL